MPTSTTFTYQAKSGGAVTSPVGFTVNLRTNASFQARSFDGGVLMGPGMPNRGAAAVRQTKNTLDISQARAYCFRQEPCSNPHMI